MKIKEKVYVAKPSLPDLSEYVSYLEKIWNTRTITNDGPFHKLLEERLSSKLKCKKLALFTNGHIALEYAIQVLGLKGEVITTPFTFASTVQAIKRMGLKPIFCDINPENYTIDVDKIESLITKETTAIIPVHVYGNICDVEAIENIASKYNLKVIYDAAHVFGVEKNGIGIGSYGDISMFSFHATKVFHTIEGGALTYSNSDLSESLSELRNFGISKSGEISLFGGNGKMDEFRSVMGLCNLKRLDEEIDRRRIVAERYKHNLQLVPGINIFNFPDNIKRNYAYFPILFNDFKKNRDQVFDELMKENIVTRKYFFPIVSDFLCYRNDYNSSETPVAKYVADNILVLPLYADLNLDIVDFICEIILK